jgi:hypothetical protein
MDEKIFKDALESISFHIHEWSQTGVCNRTVLYDTIAGFNGAYIKLEHYTPYTTLLGDTIKYIYSTNVIYINNKHITSVWR